MVDNSVPFSQRVLSLNVGPVGLRECLPLLSPLPSDTPAVVFIQVAKVPPEAVKSLKRLAHSLFPHYSLFVGRLPEDGSKALRHEVVSFVHCHLAARASLLEVSRQASDCDGASPSELLLRTHFVRTTDIHSSINVVWGNVYGFQARDSMKQEAQWRFIRAVLDRWQSQTDHVILGGDSSSSLRPRSGYLPNSAVHAADARTLRFIEQSSLSVSAPSSATVSSYEGAKESILDFFLSTLIQSVGPCLHSTLASDSPDPRHDHRVVSAAVAHGIVLSLPPLDDMRAPVLLRMGCFKDRREQWARLVEERLQSLPQLQQQGLSALARLDIIKEEALNAARKILCTSSGKLKSPI